MRPCFPSRSPVPDIPRIGSQGPLLASRMLLRSPEQRATEPQPRYDESNTRKHNSPTPTDRAWISLTSFVIFPLLLLCIAFVFLSAMGFILQHMEQEGLLRSLRVNNAQDIVPSIPFLSLFRKRLMKHTGLNLRLWNGGHRLQHSSAANFLTALRNSIFKPVWKMMKSHSLPLHEERMKEQKKDFSQMTLDDLYNNTSYVSQNFLGGKKW